MLIDTEVPVLKISLGVIIPSVVITVLFALFAVGMGLRAQAKKVTTGVEGLIGEVGETLEELDPTGNIFINGEYWKAEADAKIEKGVQIRAIGKRGIVLIVEPTESTHRRY